MGIFRKLRGSVSSSLSKIADTVAPEREQTDADRERNRLLDAVRDAGLAHKMVFAPIDTDGPKYLYGDQAAGLKVKDGWVPVTDNQIFPLVTQSQAVASLQQTTIHASSLQPEDPGEKDAAERAGKALNAIYHKELDIPRLRIEVQPDLSGIGYCVVATYWDEQAGWLPKEHRWRGAIRRDIVDPACYYCDGLATRAGIHNGAQYEFTLTRIPTLKAVARWPEWEAEILRAAKQEQDRAHNARMAGGSVLLQQKGSTSESTLTAQSREDIGTFGTNGRLLTALQYGQNANPKYAPAGEENAFPAYVTVMEMLLADYSTERIPQEAEVSADALIADNQLVVNERGEDINPATGNPYVSSADAESGHPDRWPTIDTSYEAPKYPFGRHIIRFGDSAVVHDAPWPYRHSLWQVGIKNPLPHTWRGLNDVEQAKAAQDNWNTVTMHEGNWVRNAADPGFLVKTGTIPDDPDGKNLGQWIKNRPGWCVNVTDTAGIQPKPVTPLPAGFVEIKQGVLDSLRNTLSVHATRMGETTGDTLGEVQLAEANDRMRGGVASMMLDMFTIEIMEAAWDICSQKWQLDDVIRVLGETAGQIRVDQLMLDAEFELKLEVTTNLPYDRERRKADALALFDRFAQMGMADLAIKWMLKVFEAPEAEELIAAVEARLNAVRQAQAAQAQTQAVPMEQGAQEQPTAQPPVQPPEAVAVTQGEGV